MQDIRSRKRNEGAGFMFAFVLIIDYIKYLSSFIPLKNKQNYLVNAEIVFNSGGSSINIYGCWLSSIRECYHEY